jgi:soluble lytic murein transglycosylase
MYGHIGYFMRLFVLSVLLLLAGTAAAATDAQRSEFIDALKAAQHGQLAQVAGEVADLRNYPLYDYLTAADLRYQLQHSADADTDNRVSAFIAAHPDLPPARRLRGPWLASLAKRGRWQDVIEHTRPGENTTSQCRLLHARIALGQSPVQQALAVYDVGHSQPDSCDPVFDWLQSRGALSSQVMLERARKAVLAGQFGLARYLARSLPPAAADHTAQWLNVAETPAQLADASPGLDGEVAVYAFKRLALRDLDTAAQLLKPLVARLGLSNAQRYQMRRYVALLYAQNHQPQALLWFARINPERIAGDEHALGWEIRAAIYQQRWPLVVDAIHQLPPDVAHDEEWRYWLARALAATGHKAQARSLYAALAQKRSYHGYLAADALGEKYSLNEQPVPDDPTIMAQLQARPALARARELHQLGMVYAANREWRVLIHGLDESALAQAARIAYQWQWYSRAIITLAKAGYWDDLDIRYPTPYTGDVDNAAAANNLDPAYIFAIIRTESLFQPDAHSPVGARGLMQLMPGTAAHVARAMGQSRPAASRLSDPSVNIPLGSHYLRQMLNDWNNNLVLATASYNAGPHKIAQWLPASDMPADIWIANIPYNETRSYVQRAMSHMTVFESRLQESVVPLDTRLNAIKPTYPDDTDTTY